MFSMIDKPARASTSTSRPSLSVTTSLTMTFSLFVQRRESRLVHIAAARDQDVAAVQRRLALPIGDHAARALEDRDQRHDVVRFQLTLDDEIEIAGRDHRIVVAVATETRQQALRADCAKRFCSLPREH